MSTGPWVPKEYRSLVRAAQAAGWRVEATKGCHVRFLPPSGPIVVCGTSPSKRSHRHLLADLRRAGLTISH